jgi:hypothetical protein
MKMGGKAMKTAEEIIRELPPDIQQEVLDFAEFLMSKRNPPKQQRMRLSWAGGLKEFRAQFTALELQKKALEWWDEDIPT